jgi:hypothetical protein
VRTKSQSKVDVRIPLLTGHGHLTENGSAPCNVNVDFDETYTRIGD